ncbi:DUF5685 family protein [Clostridium saccharobutylicum]|uniref:Uncharacterized protein n=1 Tax=Clostridium saccharobutylicum TaxID=169679 RepID=A0A1S8MSV5_CLOSA|nr:DUF5685 family protein [Clostridium saccharobutylicum]OOM07261.1 hypothetical protein CLOSAC_37900 [Clostridium saccharobutylicum]
MFGYVTPLKGEMKVKDFARFKCYYCGLCCHIKKEFGNIPRVSLNYDMTFLGLLLDALNPDELEVTSHRCIIHPTEKKTIIYNNRALSYAASINISLFYYKLVDDVNDDKDFKSKLGIIFLSPYKKKFSKSILNINTSIKHYLNELYILENNKSFNSIDEICDPFSKLVGTIFKDYPYELNDDSDNLRDTLYSLGYSLGKWIYLIDALDDLKSDMEKEKFNPINFLYNKKNLPYDKFVKYIKPKLEFTILNCGYNCKENLKKLDLKKNKDILYNIIELGLMDKYVKIIDSTKNTNET